MICGWLVQISGLTIYLFIFSAGVCTGLSIWCSRQLMDQFTFMMTVVGVNTGVGGNFFSPHRQVCTLHSLGNAWAVVDTFIICGWLIQISNFLIDNVLFFFPYKTALLLCCTDHCVLSYNQFTVFQCAAQLRAVCDVTDLIETSKL